MARGMRRNSGLSLWIAFVLFMEVLIIALGSSLLPAPLGLRVSFGLLTIPPTIWLYRHRISTFVPALFFALQALAWPWMDLALSGMVLPLQQMYFLPAIAMYLALVLPVERLRAEVHWLRIGRFDRITYYLIALIVLMSAGALTVWAFFIAGDLSRFEKFVPLWPLWLLALYGILFPVVNALLEEFISRAVLFDGFQSLWNGPAAKILLQAAVFALWHYQGFPGGMIGVGMVFLWSIFLGILRHRSNGMAAPLLAHFFADLTIVILQFLIMILPARHWL